MASSRPDSYLQDVALESVLQRNEVTTGSVVTSLPNSCRVCGHSEAPGLRLNDGSFLCKKCYFGISYIHYPQAYQGQYQDYLIRHSAWEKAKDACGGTEEALFATYFDEQYELLSQIKPLVVGHFDVIRLWAPDKMVKLSQWPSVWSKVVRNIEFVTQYGGLFEFNSAAFRKGFEEAYPTSEIAEVCTQRRWLTGDDHLKGRQVCSVGRQSWRCTSWIELSSCLHLYQKSRDLGVIFRGVKGWRRASQAIHCRSLNM